MKFVTRHFDLRTLPNNSSNGAKGLKKHCYNQSKVLCFDLSDSPLPKEIKDECAIQECASRSFSAPELKQCAAPYNGLPLCKEASLTVGQKTFLWS